MEIGQQFETIKNNFEYGKSNIYWRNRYSTRSAGATKNREMIKAAQRMAHDIERVCYHPDEFGEEDIEQAKIWQQKYAEYRATFSPDRKAYKHFYGWMFTEIYHGLRREAVME